MNNHPNFFQVIRGKKEDQYQTIAFILQEMGLFETDKISEQFLEKLLLIKPDLDPKILKRDLKSINDPHISKFIDAFEKTTFPCYEFFKDQILISPFAFQFLLKYLSTEPEECIIDIFNAILIQKDTADRFIVKVSIPLPIPVCFQLDSTSNYIITSFTDFDRFKSEEIREQIVTILSNVRSLPSRCIKFYSCDTIDPDGEMKFSNEVLNKNPIYFVFNGNPFVGTIYCIVKPGTSNPENILKSVDEEAPKIFHELRGGRFEVSNENMEVFCEEDVISIQNPDSSNDFSEVASSPDKNYGLSGLISSFAIFKDNVEKFSSEFIEMKNKNEKMKKKIETLTNKNRKLKNEIISLKDENNKLKERVDFVERYYRL